MLSWDPSVKTKDWTTELMESAIRYWTIISSSEPAQACLLSRKPREIVLRQAQDDFSLCTTV